MERDIMTEIIKPFAGITGSEVTGTISTQDVIHLAVESSESGSNRMTFQSSEIGTITAISDAGGGNITVTATNTLTAEDPVSLVGGTGYDDIYQVVSATASNFVITAAFVATGTGTYLRGVNFEVQNGADGLYKAGGSFTGKSSAGGADFDFYIVINDTAEFVFARTFANTTDKGNAGIKGLLITLSVGDRISFGFANTSGTANLIQEKLDILIERLSL
jgi:hypothetical protein